MFAFCVEILMKRGSIARERVDGAEESAADAAALANAVPNFYFLFVWPSSGGSIQRQEFIFENSLMMYESEQLH